MIDLNCKIYLEPTTLVKFDTPFDVLVKALTGNFYRYGVATYDKDGKEQCGSSKNRSIGDLVTIVKTYFPEITIEDAFKEILKVILAVNYRCFQDVERKNVSRSSRLMWCNDINEIVVFNDDRSLMRSNPIMPTSEHIEIYLGNLMSTSFVRYGEIYESRYVGMYKFIKTFLYELGIKPIKSWKDKSFTEYTGFEKVAELLECDLEDLLIKLNKK